MNAPFLLSRELLSRMEPDELWTIMFKLGCPTQRALADKIGVSSGAVSAWYNGSVGVPRPIAMLLRLLAKEAA